MISPKLKDKVYGVVHDGHDFRYIGFCKKVHSEEKQHIDVFIDDKKIETLICDKTVDKISQIYDITNFGFSYDLPEKYIGSKHSVNFTYNGTVLENSPIQTIEKTHPKFNEHKFLSSLNNVDEEKIKDLYCKDAIGFLAVEENLEDKDFLEYIEELYVRFPKVTFKAFYFNAEQKKMAESIFLNNLSKIDLIKAKNIYNLISKIEVYLFNTKHSGVNRKVYDYILFFCESILSIRYTKSNKYKTIKEEDKTFIRQGNIVLQNPHYFGLKAIENSVYKTLYNTILSQIQEKAINTELSLYEFECFLKIKYTLKSTIFKKYVFNLTLKYIKSYSR